MRRAAPLTLAALLTLGGCTATIDQSSLLPAMREPAPAPVAASAGYARQDRLVTLPDLGTVHVARLVKQGNRATVIYSGGNGSFVSTSGKRLNELAAVTGADIVTFDYPGRGGTTMPKTTEALIAFGPALLAALRRDDWLGAGPLYSYGFSLGGATASNIARAGPVDGLILEATAADIPAVARNMIPMVLRPFIRLKVSDDVRHFDYTGYAVAARAPILILAGDRDRTVDARTAKRFATSLRQAGATVTVATVPGDHGDALSSVEGRTAIQRFMDRPAR